MTYGGRFFYVNILLIVKCVMKFFYVIASLRSFSRHCEYTYVGSSNTSLRGFVEAVAIFYFETIYEDI